MNDEIKSITDRLKGCVNVRAAILFGSFAKGRARKDSDIDICVICDKPSDEPLSFSSKKMDISLFDRLPLVLRHRVFRDGIVLFNKDDKLFSRLKFQTLSQYLDEKHWRDRFVEKVLS